MICWVIISTFLEKNGFAQISPSFFLINHIVGLNKGYIPKAVCCTEVNNDNKSCANLQRKAPKQKSYLTKAQTDCIDYED